MTKRTTFLWLGCALCSVLLLGFIALKFLPGMDLTEEDLSAGHRIDVSMGRSSVDREHGSAETASRAETVPFAADEAVAPEEIGWATANALCVRLVQAVKAGETALVSEYRRRLLLAGSEAVSSLKPLIYSGNSRVELAALRLLIEIGDAEGVAAAVVRVLSIPAGQQDVLEYVRAFARSRNPDVPYMLVELLSRTEDEEMESRLLLLLETISGENVVAALADRLEGAEDAQNLREIYEEMLAASSDPMQGEILMGIYDETQSESLKQLAADALASVGTAETCRYLIERASDDDEALAALTQIDSSYAQEALLGAANDGAIPIAVRSAVIAALARHNSERVLIALENIADGVLDEELGQELDEAITVLRASLAPATENAVASNGSRDELWFKR